MDAFLYRDFAGGRDLLDRRLMAEGRRLHLLRSLDAHVRRAFKDPRARKILEYPVVFLGASPRGAPALYSLLSHADLNLGVWYPAGGLGAVAESLARLAEGLGVRIRAGSEATGVASSRGRATAVRMGDLEIPADAVLATGDYHWMETRVLRSAQRTYGEAWWDRRTTAPSMLVAYLGLDGPLAGAAHHTLYFSRDWNRHFRAVFDRPRWPGDPCWYLGRTTATDPSMAPPGKENLFLLVPLAPGLEDSDATREAFFDRLARRIREETGIDLLAGLAVKRLYGPSDFAADYRAWRGTALGLAHTLRQTAVFRPARRSRKLENLYYAGQYTHPGVGVPMALIAARLAAEAMGAGR